MDCLTSCDHQAPETPRPVRPSHSNVHARVPRQSRVHDDRSGPPGGRHGEPIPERHRLQVRQVQTTQMELK